MRNFSLEKTQHYFTIIQKQKVFILELSLHTSKKFT